MCEDTALSGAPRVRMPRLLVITPDYPPAHGGIQVFAHRIASLIRGFETRIVALDGPGAEQFDAGQDLRIRRVPTDRRLRGGRNLLLNAFALAEALRFRPDVTLSLHI